MVFVHTKTVSNQVDEILLERIREGMYLPGIRMPSESELSDEFGVSRATVRTALAKLAASGIILRKQGDGTYVNAHIHEASAQFGNLWDLVQLIEGNGYKPSIKFLTIEKRPACEKEALVLAIDKGEDVICLRRLFYADQQPVIFADNVIPYSLLKTPLESIDGSLHIREIFRNYFNQRIVFAITDIRSTVMDDLAGSYLSGGLGRSILQLQVVLYGRNNLPIATGVNIFDDAILRLSLAQAWF
ncbi:MAG: GntR family transcriptional regulator [Anaerolineales bacterium]|nr:GntR family transcriptional regulator [Anaerolineales bacterium]MCB9144321.1 GntR family transcriptional regulator [Anaerolineales bacterium]